LGSDDGTFLVFERFELCEGTTADATRETVDYRTSVRQCTALSARHFRDVNVIDENDMQCQATP
jgi:hypothetical protein